MQFVESTTLLVRIEVRIKSKAGGASIKQRVFQKEGHTFQLYETLNLKTTSKCQLRIIRTDGNEDLQTQQARQG